MAEATLAVVSAVNLREAGQAVACPAWVPCPPLQVANLSFQSVSEDEPKNQELTREPKKPVFSTGQMIDLE